LTHTVYKRTNHLTGVGASFSSLLL